MTHTQEYLLTEIVARAAQALGIEPTLTVEEEGIITLRVDSTRSEAPFWRAIVEQIISPKDNPVVEEETSPAE